MPIAKPFLMFEGKAEAALTFYCATVAGSRIVDLQRYGAEGPGKEGNVSMARAVIAGLEI